MMGISIDPWVRNKSDELAVDQGCYFDMEAADKVRRFFSKYLRHSKGEFSGKPFELLDWQWQRLIAPAFGWKRPDGTRRFRRIGCAVPKKNGKSTLLAGVSIYMTCADGEPGAEVYSAGADRDQASIIYNEAANMIEASPALLRRLEVKRSNKTFSYPKYNSWYKALSAEVATKEGLNIHCLLFDELHAQKTWDLWNALRYGGISRRQPMLWWITTAGVGADPTTLCNAQWNYAKSIQEGTAIDVSFLPCIYEAMEDTDDWQDPAVWAKTNPSFGVTMSEADFKQDVEEVKGNPVNEGTFKRYRLNMRTKQATKWIPMNKWYACGAKPFTARDCVGWKCTIALDLATTTDLAAAVAVFRLGNRYRIIPHFWVPEESMAVRERENRTKLKHWVAAGYITATDGDVIDYQVIRNHVNDWASRFKCKDVVIDDWNATSIAQDLEDDGLTVHYLRMGFASIGPATKEFDKLVRGGLLEHANNPVMDWMISNIAVEQDANGNIRPDKKRSAEKIDGPVAAILGLAHIINVAAPKKSVYKQRGIQSVGYKK